MSVSFIAIVTGTENNYMYMFYNNDTAFCIDPCEPEVLMKCLGMELEEQVYTKEEILRMSENRPKRRTLTHSFTTHSHCDHSRGNTEIGRQNPGVIQVSGFEGEICKCGDKFYSCGMEVECLYTPCHTKDSFCYYINGEYLATGDTLFFLGCGKFFEGTASDMLRNIEKIKKKVDHKSILLYGHDYNAIDTEFAEKFFDIPPGVRSTRFLRLEDEMKYNPFFNLREIGMEGSDKDVMNELRKRKNEFKTNK